MARSRMKHGKACNYAKQQGVNPKDVYAVLVRNHGICIVRKSEIIRHNNIRLNKKLNERKHGQT